ncbi:oxidoreductase [Aureococcus anophagefferens]|uniref:Oxidoreductase n=1 Tax=Aureococcus anophagefferens TaxID=44056 RepID=A0ABR1GDJ7_AURAN
MVSPQTSPSKKDGSPTFHKGIKRVARHVLDSDRVLQLMEMNGILEPEKAYVLEAANLHLEDIYDLSDVPRLRTLDVTNNRLTNLRNLVGVRHLRELRAGTNRIDDADDVGVCKELEALYLQDNLLEEAPRTLGGLRSLKTLRLDRCRLSGSVGPGLAGCAALTSLDLSGNALASFAGLASLGSLTELDMSRNGLTAVPLGALEGCRATLAELRLGDNEIGSVALDAAAPADNPEADDESTDAPGEGLNPVPARMLSGIQRKMKNRRKAPGARRPPAGPADGRARARRGPLDGLKAFHNLKTLVLARNHLASTQALPKFAGLVELDVSENRVADLGALAAVAPNLDVLNVGGNRLDDISAVVEALRPGTSGASRPCTAAAGAPGWALLCARAFAKLEVLDDLRVEQPSADGDGGDDDASAPLPTAAPAIKPLATHHTKTLERLEPMDDTDARVAAFRRRLAGVRGTLRELEVKEMKLMYKDDDAQSPRTLRKRRGAEPNAMLPKPPQAPELAKKLNSLERALSFGRPARPADAPRPSPARSPERSSKPGPADGAPPPPPSFDEQFQADAAADMDRRDAADSALDDAKTWKARVDEMIREDSGSDSSDDEGAGYAEASRKADAALLRSLATDPAPEAPPAVPPLPPNLARVLEDHLTPRKPSSPKTFDPSPVDMDDPAVPLAAALADADALPVNVDLDDDPDAFATRAKYESMMQDYTEAMEAAKISPAKDAAAADDDEFAVIPDEPAAAPAPRKAPLRRKKSGPRDEFKVPRGKIQHSPRNVLP